MYLAQFNLAKAKFPLEAPEMEGFTSRLGEINQLAAEAPGFVWRMETDDEDNPFAQDKTLVVNMSVWDGVESLHAYTYKTAHSDVMRQRKNWMEPRPGPHLVMWWIPSDHRPTLREAYARLRMLTALGSTPEAFDFKSLQSIPSQSWKRVRKEYVVDLKLFNAWHDFLINPRNGKTEKMIVLDGPDSVNTVAVTTNNEVVLVKQYRAGVGGTTLELPGGLIDGLEWHETAAKRELQEETGYAGGYWRYLGAVGSNPVFMSNYVFHWVAQGVSKQFEQNQDSGEDVEYILMPVDEVKEKLGSGFFKHPHTITGLNLFFAPSKN